MNRLAIISFCLTGASAGVIFVETDRVYVFAIVLLVLYVLLAEYYTVPLTKKMVEHKLKIVAFCSVARTWEDVHVEFRDIPTKKLLEMMDDLLSLGVIRKEKGIIKMGDSHARICYYQAHKGYSESGMVVPMEARRRG